jgi:hypothetical protein
MMKQFSLTTTINQAAPVFGAAALTGLAFFGMQAPAQAFNILAGSDYWTTTNNGSTFFDFGPGIGQVGLMGLPVGPGNSDTVVTRLEDAIFDDNNDGIVERTSDTIRIEMNTLSLKSINQVNVGGTLYDVLVSLNDAQASTGTMTINHDVDDNNKFVDNNPSPAPEGTFSSVINVNFKAEFVDGGGNINDALTVLNSLPLSSENGLWSHDPTPGTTLVNGPVGDLLANNHINNDPLVSGFDDFFTSFLVEEHPTGARHEVCTANGGPCPVPEPLTTLASVTGLGFGAMLKRKNDKKNKKQQKA